MERTGRVYTAVLRDDLISMTQQGWQLDTAVQPFRDRRHDNSPMFQGEYLWFMVYQERDLHQLLQEAQNRTRTAEHAASRVLERAITEITQRWDRYEAVHRSGGPAAVEEALRAALTR